MALIDIKELTFSYGNKPESPVLNNISMTIDEGDFFLLCGASASGKTTLLRLIKHLIAPYGTKKGVISIHGDNVESMSEYDLVSQVGFVFQNPDHQIVCEKPFAELAFGLENLGVKSDEIRHRVAEMANFFGIEQYFNKNINELSGGQKQLLNLAAIMVMQPAVLLLDEPTAMLDPIATEEFLHILDKLNKELGLTIILCEHNLDKVYPLIDRVCVLEKGNVLFTGNAAEGVNAIFDHSPATALSMPAAVSLFKAHSKKHLDTLPLTVKSGRKWLKTLSPSQIKLIQDAEVKTSDSNIPDRTKTAFELKKIYFRYSKNEEFILNNLMLTGYPGEILTLVGGNGVGKSTLLSVLSGYRKPTAGKVSIGRVGYMPQDPVLLFSEDTIGAEIQTTIADNHLDTSAADKLAESFPSINRILHDKTANPLDLSGGGKQLLAFYKLALFDIDVLILDEPVKGLDGLAKKELADILNQFKAEGVCVVIVTHDLDFAAMVSDRIGMMFQGQIISLDKPFTFFIANHFYTTSRCKIGKDIILGLI